jgi:hypothetical protein
VKIPFLNARRAARITLASSVTMLLPLLAAADSQLSVGGASLRATAHVDFKVVIPAVLSLDMPGDAESVRGTPSVAIFSNNHNVMLAATSRLSEKAQGSVVLSSAAKKVIAQKVACTTGSSRAAALPATTPRGGESDADGVVCTACVP